MMRPKQRNRNRAQETGATSRMVDAIDSLTEFERFNTEILPKLRKLVSKGASAEEIYRFHEAHAAARAVTIAMTDDDTGKALAAVKEILDRGKGKAIERREIAIENMTDADLDKMIQEELLSLQGDDSDGHVTKN